MFYTLSLQRAVRCLCTALFRGYVHGGTLSQYSSMQHENSK